MIKFPCLIVFCCTLVGKMADSDSKLEKYENLFNSDSFKTSARGKQICLFLGAGVAKNIGMPSWQELASLIANCCLEKDILKHSSIHILNSLNDPLKIISYCVSEMIERKKEKHLDSIIKKAFATIPQKKYRESTVYRDLVKLYESGKVLIVQTNYDNIIAQKCNLPTSQTYIPYKDDPKNIDNSMLVYLHGKIEEQPPLINNLILTRSDYNRVYVNQNDTWYEKQQSFIKRLLYNYHIIFLGYSLQDNEIIQLIANKGIVENHLGTSVIFDNCKAKEIENDITASYLSEFSNNNLKLYYYDTEDFGIKKNFETVVNDLKNAILKDTTIPNMQKFKEGKGVIFERSNNYKRTM